MPTKTPKFVFTPALPDKKPRVKNAREGAPVRKKKLCDLPAAKFQSALDSLVETVETEQKEQPLQPKTVARIERFLTEYVKDFCFVRAAVRFGCSTPRYARKVGEEMAKHPYFQKALHRTVRTMQEKAIVTRSQIIAALWREANDQGLDSDSSSRTRALCQLSKISGMEITRIEGDVKHTSKVIVIPAGLNLDEWQAAATLQQQQIKQLPASAVTLEVAP